MPRHADTRIERVLAPCVLAVLFAGIGALGWLVGHLATYDALGQAHDHASHGYMSPLEQGGSTLSIVGIVLALVLAIGSRELLVGALDRWRRSNSLIPWIAAATMPSLTFLAVEFVEGSIATRGMGLLLVGMPLQVLMGITVMAIVRSLLAAIVEVTARFVGRAPRHVVRPAPLQASTTAAFVHVGAAPMASSAPRRGPPSRTP